MFKKYKSNFKHKHFYYNNKNNNNNNNNPFKNNELKVGSKTLVHCYKFNGWLYRTWCYPTVIENNDECVILSANSVYVNSSEKRTKRIFKSTINKPTFWFLFKKEWFNIIATLEESQTLKWVRIYINLASPFIYEDRVIKYFDFDLDFKSNSLGKWKLLDSNEYKENQIELNYPIELINKIDKTTDELRDKIKNEWLNKYVSLVNIEQLIQKTNEINKQRKEFKYESKKYNSEN